MGSKITVSDGSSHSATSRSKLVLTACVVLAISIVWQMYETSNNLDELLQLVSLRDEEVIELEQTFEASEESAQFLRDAVSSQAKEVVRQEEETLRELLLGEAKTYANTEMVSVEHFRSQVMEIVSKHIKTFMKLRSGEGGAAGLIDLGRDVRDYVKKYRHSNIPPDVREWFVFFTSEVRRLATLEDSSEILLKALKKNFWINPAPESTPYNLLNPHKEDGSDGQALRLMQIFKHKKNGVFIECGAFDGEEGSTTLFLERRLEWTGALIEPSPDHFSRMLNKNRRAVLIPACVSPKPEPMLTKLYQTQTGGMLLLQNETEIRAAQVVDNIVDAFCFPFSTIFAALDKNFVDLLILNAHGLELDILGTISWDQVNVGTVIVSTKYLKDQKEAILNLMFNVGFVDFDQRHDDEYWAKNNLIFIRPDTKRES